MGETARSRAKERGEFAEAIAAERLAAQGYEILERNFRTREGEADLIVERDRWLVFVEVRFRRTALFGTPEETVGALKRRKVVLAALEYLARHGMSDRPVRFDVVSVRRAAGGLEVEHIEDAFDAGFAARGEFFSHA